jgi:pimeloyl-ACP methyl ester carboxylesterase
MKTIPLLLIHGYPFDHTLWFSTIASLGSKAKVIAPDLPGFGKADLLRDTEPSMDAYAQFLLDHLSENKHDKVAVVGMSMGGYVALAFAEKYPDRVAGLGLISSQAVSDSEDARKARQEMISKITAQDPSVAAEAIIPKMFGQKHASNPDLLKYPREGAERAGRNGLIWALQAMAARPDRTSVLTSLHCPVLVVHGSEDKIVPLSQAHLTADHSRKPIFVEIQGAGHATPLEAPDQVANALVRLLQTCQDAASA